MTTSLLLIAAGMVLLYLGAEWLVGGASALARAAGIPPLIVGLTVVAYGTSMPELVVSALAALEGKSGIALGNVIGSNIANIGVILGVTALIAPPRVGAEVIREDCPPMVLAAASVPAVLWDGLVSRVEGLVLLGVAAAITARTVARARRAEASPGPDREAGAGEPAGSRGAQLGKVLLGLVTLVAAGKLFVDGASELARQLGISERVIGLTIVSVGTSLPELAASVLAAWRGHADLAVGNVVGSNIFNVFLILGCSAAIAPVPGRLDAMGLDLGALGLFTALAAWCMRGEREISRVEGGLLLALYAAFTGLLLGQPG